MSLRDEKYKFEHPSYGRVVVTKPSGGSIRLFASEVKHRNCVSLAIEHAELVQDIHGDWIHGKKHVVEIYMSEAQWAHMLSSFGDGGGTPCTIRWTQENGYIDFPPEIPTIPEVQKEVLNDIGKALKQQVVEINKLLVEMLARPSVRKKDLEGIKHRMEILNSHFNSNLDYCVEATKERMEKEVAKARVEIDALVNRYIHDVGVKVLAEEKDKQLTEGNND